MQFIAHREVFDRFPGLHLPVVVAHGLDNHCDSDPNNRAQIEALWREAWAGAASAAQYGNAQSHPSVQPWRERFRAMGVSGKEFPSSVEALLRRALKGGEPVRINPLVDFYNSVSLRYLVPAGGFDLSDVHDPLELRLTRPGDRFLALDAPAEEPPLDVPSDEVAYAYAQTILTRHFVWRQSRAGLITETTRDVFLVSEVLGELGPETAEAVLDSLRSGVKEYFHVPTLASLVNASNPSFSW